MGLADDAKGIVNLFGLAMNSNSINHPLLVALAVLYASGGSSFFKLLRHSLVKVSSTLLESGKGTRMKLLSLMCTSPMMSLLGGVFAVTCWK